MSISTEAMAPDRRRVWYALMMAAPPLLVGAATLVLLLAAIVGLEPLWAQAELTMAEAAALRDAGMVARLIDEGQDPNRRVPVRADMLRSQALTLTPLDAAVAARRLEIVRLLVQNGARVDGANRATLICFAQERDAADIAEYLMGLGDRITGTPSCDGVALPW